MALPLFNDYPLNDGLVFHTGTLPRDLVWTDTDFERLWNRHPHERHTVIMIGKPVQVPRWQQAYGANYSYTGSRNNALPIPRELLALLEWSRKTIDDRLNGLLLNWYSGAEDYIGAHHDSTKELVQGSPIVTISFGETRVFRLTRWERRQKVAQHDFEANHGRVFVVDWDMNKAWKHEVLKRAAYSGRRISVTLRAFSRGLLLPEQSNERDTTPSEIEIH